MGFWRKLTDITEPEIKESTISFRKIEPVGETISLI